VADRRRKLFAGLGERQYVRDRRRYQHAPGYDFRRNAGTKLLCIDWRWFRRVNWDGDTKEATGRIVGPQ